MMYNDFEQIDLNVVQFCPFLFIQNFLIAEYSVNHNFS